MNRWSSTYVMLFKCYIMSRYSMLMTHTAIVVHHHIRSMDGGKRPALHEGHAAPLIQIFAWIFCTFSTLSIVAHFATRKVMSRPFTRSDLVMFATLILAMGQTITFVCHAGQAVGNTQANLSEETIVQAWKALYSGEILSVATIVAAKGALLVPFSTVTPVPKHRIMMYISCVVTVLWGSSAMLLIAFQCPSPQRWKITNPQCLDVRAIRTYNAIMNIITDFALAAVPTMMVLPLQIDSSTRLTLLAGFWSRIVVMIASVAQIRYIRTLSPYPDLLYSIWPVVVCGQVFQVTSIMTSTIPFLKPFLLSLESSLTLNSISAIRTTATPTYTQTGNTNHTSSYIKIGIQHNQDATMDTDHNIWVTTDVRINREQSVELSELQNTSKGRTTM